MHDAAASRAFTGVAIVTDSTSHVPAAAGSGLRFEDRREAEIAAWIEEAGKLEKVVEP